MVAIERCLPASAKGGKLKVLLGRYGDEVLDLHQARLEAQHQVALLKQYRVSEVLPRSIARDGTRTGHHDPRPFLRVQKSLEED